MGARPCRPGFGSIALSAGLALVGLLAISASVKAAKLETWALQSASVDAATARLGSSATTLPR